MGSTETAAAGEDLQRRTAALLRLQEAGVRGIRACRGCAEPYTAATIPIDLLETLAELAENPESIPDWRLPDDDPAPAPQPRRRWWRRPRP